MSLRVEISDIAFFSAGGSISAKYAKYAVEAGAVVIDQYKSL